MIWPKFARENKDRTEILEQCSLDRWSLKRTYLFLRTGDTFGMNNKNSKASSWKCPCLAIICQLAIIESVMNSEGAGGKASSNYDKILISLRCFGRLEGSCICSRTLKCITAESEEWRKPSMRPMSGTGWWVRSRRTDEQWYPIMSVCFRTQQ